MPEMPAPMPLAARDPAGFPARLAIAGDTSRAVIGQALSGLTGPVADGMRHALQGGKAMRAFLVLESARLCGFDDRHAGPAAAGIEAMHAYSLVHDDLPCMDDDDLRRGRPTVHVKWDEATAVLVGDALQALAFQLVAAAACRAEARLHLVTTLAAAAGVRGMVGGQAADIAAETAATPLTLDRIVALQAQKTGALIGWSVCAGPRMAGAEDSALARYGDNLGLAFQVWDDVLDVIGDAARLGKAVGKDGAAHKATFVSILGLDGARRRARDLVAAACDSLAAHGAAAEPLREAARFAITRDR